MAEEEIFPVDGLLDMGALWQIARLPGLPELRFAPMSPITHPRLLRHEGERPDVLGAMRDGDVLVHHPYDPSRPPWSASSSRPPPTPTCSRSSRRCTAPRRLPLVPALIDATERGKQVVALVELKARFDERMNIHWAKALEEAGVHVVYGQPALKTHVKCVLVVRREGEGVRNYVHIGTGNYHSTTARLYTDFGLFTTDPQIGADVADMFNYLTGRALPALPQGPDRPRPTARRAARRDRATIAAHPPSTPRGSSPKMNALVDGPCIRALYRASQAGVRVD